MVRRNKGYLLVEVMVALAIIALSLAGVVVQISRSIDEANTLRDRTYANWIAQNKIAELRLANVTPEPTTTSGEIDYAGTEWAWRAVVINTEIETLFRVDVEVSFPGSIDRIWLVTGFIGEPTAPGIANQSWSSAPQSRSGPPGARQ